MIGFNIKKYNIMYKKHWSPNKAQRREFAERMQTDTEFAAAYEQRKTARIEKRKQSSSFDYDSAGGVYVPTKRQHDFCCEYDFLFQSIEEQTAKNEVISGWVCQSKVHHDYIHIVNEKIRTIKS